MPQTCRFLERHLSANNNNAASSNATFSDNNNAASSNAPAEENLPHHIVNSF
jgi:hypothetical protein